MLLIGRVVELHVALATAYEILKASHLPSYKEPVRRSFRTKFSSASTPSLPAGRGTAPKSKQVSFPAFNAFHRTGGLLQHQRSDAREQEAGFYAREADAALLGHGLTHHKIALLPLGHRRTRENCNKHDAR